MTADSKETANVVSSPPVEVPTHKETSPEEGGVSETFSKDDDTAATASTSTSTVTSGSMQCAMDAKRQEIATILPKEVFEIYGRKMKEYAESPVFQYTLKRGDTFPDFSLPDETGAFCSSVDLLVSSYDYLVVTFFRGGWCGFCNTELAVLNRYVPEFRAKNAAFVAIAPQKVEQNMETRKKMNLGFPLLQDEDCEFAQLCNIAYVLDEELRPFASDIPSYNGNDDWIIPIPATFVVRGSDRKIMYSFYEVDPSMRAEPNEILASIVSEDQEAAEEVRKSELEKEKRRTEGPKTLNDALLMEVERLEELELETNKGSSRSSMRSIAREIRALNDAGIASAALQVGRMAPDFKLPLCSNPKKTYELKKLIKKSGGSIVILFLHGDWSPFCRIALKAWNEKYETLQAKGAGLVAISPSQCDEQMIKVDFPILWDEQNVVAKQFRLRYQMDAQLHGQMQPWPLPMTATYVVGNTSNGAEILFAHADCDHTKRADPVTVIANHVPAGKATYKRKRGAFSLRLRGWLPIGNKQKVAAS